MTGTIRTILGIGFFALGLLFGLAAGWQYAVVGVVLGIFFFYWGRQAKAGKPLFGGKPQVVTYPQLQQPPYYPQPQYGPPQYAPQPQVIYVQQPAAPAPQPSTVERIIGTVTKAAPLALMAL